MIKSKKVALSFPELEAVVRLTLKAVPGCVGITRIKVAREIRARPGSPNWDVSEINEFPQSAEKLICSVIEQLREKFDLVTG